MVFDVLLESVNVLSVLATTALVILTIKPCRASGVPYLLSIPTGFGLMTVAFAVQALQPFLVSSSPLLGSPVEAVWLLIETYGVLFIAFAYARRTRLLLLGESETADLLVAGLVTLVFLVVIFATQAFGAADAASTNGEFFLRGIITAASIYLVYETLRNWKLTQKASQGIVTVGFAFFFVAQLGFILALGNLGSVAIFLAYEGRLMSLFLLNTILIVGMKKDDPVAVMRRLGLGAPTHSRPTYLQK
ncbi:MAG: hypothetical protein ABSF63_09465 [Candidatus Bathyarchaeia archaeon]|jgi:hypothetical protein